MIQVYCTHSHTEHTLECLTGIIVTIYVILSVTRWFQHNNLYNQQPPLPPPNSTHTYHRPQNNTNCLGIYILGYSFYPQKRHMMHKLFIFFLVHISTRRLQITDISSVSVNAESGIKAWCCTSAEFDSRFQVYRSIFQTLSSLITSTYTTHTFFNSLIINILAISHFDFKIIQDRLTLVSRTWLLFLVSVRSHGLCSQRSWNRQLPSNLLWWNETSYNEVYENIDKNLFIKNFKLLSRLFFK